MLSVSVIVFLLTLSMVSYSSGVLTLSFGADVAERRQFKEERLARAVVSAHGEWVCCYY